MMWRTTARSFCFLITTALLALLLVAAGAVPAAARRAAPGWQIMRLTDNGVDDSVPSIEGNVVVWQRGKDASAEIYAQNLRGGGAIQITNNTVEDANPDISADHMVWERWDGADSEIILRNRASGVVTQISSDADDDHFPRVWGNGVVWEHNWPMQDVVLYDILGGGTNTVSSSAMHDSLGDIAGRVIVWQQNTHNAAEVMLRDIGSWQLSQLTLNAESDGVGATDGRMVAWSHYDGVDNEIMLYDISSGATMQLTNNSVDDYFPVVAGPWVAWVRDEGANNQIWAKNGSTGVETQLTSDAANKEGLQISGPRLVWYQSDGNDFDVYTAAYRTFPDVLEDHPNYVAIESLADELIVGGYRGGFFIPDAPVKRAQFAKMIVGALGIPVDESMVAPFSDLGDDDPISLYPHEFVAAAAAEGITNGVGAGTFAPWDDISRAQVVTMAMRGAAQWWHLQLVAPPPGYAGSLGVFDPVHAPNMLYAEWRGFMEGVVGFGPAWDPWKPASRAEVAQIVWAVREALKPYLSVKAAP